MKVIYPLLLALGCWACSGDQKPPPETPQGSTVHAAAKDTIVAHTKPITLAGCYQRVVQRDTFTLELNVMGSVISGNLVYNFDQKDDNTGTLKGQLDNNHLYAFYTFRSEGRTSTREVAFQVQDTVLLEGSGPVVMRGGKQVFRSYDGLQYDSTHPFVRVTCAPGAR